MGPRPMVGILALFAIQCESNPVVPVSGSLL